VEATARPSAAVVLHGSGALVNFGCRQWVLQLKGVERHELGRTLRNDESHLGGGNGGGGSSKSGRENNGSAAGSDRRSTRVRCHLLCA
jgi:hypothetical protein